MIAKNARKSAALFRTRTLGLMVPDDEEPHYYTFLSHPINRNLTRTPHLEAATASSLATFDVLHLSSPNSVQQCIRRHQLSTTTPRVSQCDRTWE